MRAALRGRDADGARRHAGRLGGEPARRGPRRPRLRARADAPLLRPLRRGRGQRVWLYGGRDQGALAAAGAVTSAATTPASRSSAATRRPSAADCGRRRGGRVGRRSTGQPGRRLGRASACRSRRTGWHACARGSRCRCCAASAQRSTSTPAVCRRRPPGCRSAASSGPTGSARSRGGCWPALPARQPALRGRRGASVHARAARARRAPPRLRAVGSRRVPGSRRAINDAGAGASATGAPLVSGGGGFAGRHLVELLGRRRPPPAAPAAPSSTSATPAR